jgi:hypothetical protein
MLRQNGLLIIENELLKDKNTAFSYGFKPLVNEKIARKFFSQIYQLT